MEILIFFSRKLTNFPSRSGKTLNEYKSDESVIIIRQLCSLNVASREDGFMSRGSVFFLFRLGLFHSSSVIRLMMSNGDQGDTSYYPIITRNGHTLVTSVAYSE
jgi:hypothetical protein